MDLPFFTRNLGGFVFVFKLARMSSHAAAFSSAADLYEDSMAPPPVDINREISARAEVIATWGSQRERDFVLKLMLSDDDRGMFEFMEFNGGILSWIHRPIPRYGSLLGMAVKKNASRVLSLLLKLGSDPNAEYEWFDGCLNFKCSPFQIAMFKDSLDIPGPWYASVFVVGCG